MKRVKTFIAKFFWDYPLFGFFCIVMSMMAIVGSISAFFMGIESSKSALMRAGMAGFVICFSIFLIILLSVMWKKELKFRKADFLKWMKFSEL